MAKSLARKVFLHLQAKDAWGTFYLALLSFYERQEEDALVYLKDFLQHRVENRRDECDYCTQKRCTFCSKEGECDEQCPNLEQKFCIQHARCDCFKFCKCQRCNMSFCTQLCLKKSFRNRMSHHDGTPTHRIMCNVLAAFQNKQIEQEDLKQILLEFLREQTGRLQ